MLSRYFALIFALAVVMGACQPTSSETIGEVAYPFFDLKGFFESEINRLNQKNGFAKQTAVNEVQETKQLDSLDFEKELNIFLDSDINRIAWFDKYSIDSTVNAGQLVALQYKAKEDRLVIKNIQIDFENQAVTRIRIDREADTALADTDINLTYEPQKGYSISNKQALTMGEDKTFLVQVDF